MAAAPGQFRAILQGVGAPVTPRTVNDLAAWNRAEGGSASNNPFNTTEGGFGGSNYNSVGVKNYPTSIAGIRATVRTLNNGRYGNILSALRTGGDPSAFSGAIGSSPWGTSGSLVASILKTKPTSLNTRTTLSGARPMAQRVTSPGNPAALSNFLLRNSMSLLNGGYGAPLGELAQALATHSQAPTAAPVASQGVPTRNLASVKGELSLPAAYKPTHETGGLAGFPAIDNFAAAGTPVLAPVGGRMVYVHDIPWNQSAHVGGRTAYLIGDNGKTYFLTHLAGNVPTGAVSAGSPIGKVAAVPGGWWPSHIHEGAYNGIYNPPGA